MPLPPASSTEDDETSTEAELNSLLMNQQHLLSGVSASLSMAVSTTSGVSGASEGDPFLQQPPASASFGDDEDVEGPVKLHLSQVQDRTPKSLLSRKSFIDAVGSVAAAGSSSSSFSPSSSNVRILSPPGASTGSGSSADGGNVIRLGRSSHFVLN